jgi:ParB family chromosome partitioning protein
MSESASQTLQDATGLYRKIKIDQVIRSPHQARKYFDPVKLTNLAESIRQEGLQVPVIVRLVACSDQNCEAPKLDQQEGMPSGSEGSHWHAELVAGERRIRACGMLGLHMIEAKIIQTVSEGSAAAKGLIDNLQRENLDPIEEAEGFRDLLDLHDEHWTQARIADVTGKKQSHVSEAIALLGLPADIVENIRRRIITPEHGVELFRINNANSQKGMANKIIKGGWSVKKTREMVDRKLGKIPSPAPSGHPLPEGRGPTAVDLPPLGEGSRRPDEGEVDPLASIWSHVSDAPGRWDAVYDAEGWHFHVQVQGEDPQVDMKDWFTKILKAFPEPKVEGAKPITPKRVEVPVPQVSEAVYVSGNRLQLKWVPLGEGYHYQIMRTWSDSEDLSTYEPLDAPKVSTPGAIVNLYKGGGNDVVCIAVRSIDPKGHESKPSAPIRFELTAENERNDAQPLG